LVVVEKRKCKPGVGVISPAGEVNGSSMEEVVMVKGEVGTCRRMEEEEMEMVVEETCSSKEVVVMGMAGWGAVVVWRGRR
jgi:hypothetical protein